jgi:N-acetylmuramoyl-L-alanine amidase
MRTAFLTFLALAFLAATPCFAAPEFTWQVVKSDGRDYVTFESMAQFYGLTGLKREGGSGILSLGTRSLRGQAGSVEFFINNLKFNLSYPVVDVNGHLCVSRMDLVKVIEPVLRPSKIKGAEQVGTIILDPGHGGYDNGATSAYGNEKTFTLDVANRARLLLLQAGFKVFMTRNTDVFIPLEERVQFANKFPNGLFISIHFNSGGNATGLETYTLAPRGVPSMMADGPRISDLQPCSGNVCDAENMALATATHAAMVVHSRMYDRGIKRARFVVIRDIMIPGVLLEGGFLSNPFDSRMIATPEYRQQMATSIYQAVVMYRKAVGPQPAVEFAAKTPTPPLRETPPAPAPEPIAQKAETEPSTN